MAIKPILFNTEMVKAILAGRKTQTRRVLKPAHGGNLEVHDYFGTSSLCERCGSRCCGLKPPCEPDDILWVRETWRPAKGIIHTYIGGGITESGDWHNGFDYKVGGFYFPDGFEERNDEFHLSDIRSEGNWHPSIHMPKEAARIFLRVKDVRVERLKNVTGNGLRLEGMKVKPLRLMDSFSEFSSLWNSTIKKADLSRYGWDANPWVWVIEFERCDKPEGWCKDA